MDAGRRRGDWHPRDHAVRQLLRRQHGDGALTAEREHRAGGVGAEAAGGRRGDGPDGALGARRGPLGGRRQRSRGRARAVGEDRRDLLPGAGGRRRGRGPLRRCHDGGACSVAVAPATATEEDSAMG